MVDRIQKCSPATRKATQSYQSTEDRVGVTSERKLRGYARYLEVERNTPLPDGTIRTTYTYRIPRGELGRALNAGGCIADEGVNENAQAAQPGPGSKPQASAESQYEEGK
jgi:hypothetical protein